MYIASFLNLLTAAWRDNHYRWLLAVLCMLTGAALAAAFG